MMTAETKASKDTPCVGIYWGVPSQAGEISIVIDVSVLAEAEPYGDFLTHPRGHYDVWEAWRRLGPARLARRGLPDAILMHEYEDFPRGRVVYDGDRKRFVIYADRKLQTPSSIIEIVRAFHLEAEAYVVQSDLHYRSRSNHLFRGE
jgi:hypothetical protein